MGLSSLSFQIFSFGFTGSDNASFLFHESVFYFLSIFFFSWSCLVNWLVGWLVHQDTLGGFDFWFRISNLFLVCCIILEEGSCGGFATGD